MKKHVDIEKIVNYLQNSGFDISFKGELGSSIIGFSSLFNYKKNTMTFIVPERDFNDFQDKFHDKKISLMIISSKEKNYNCFDNVIITNMPRKVFFAVVEEFFENEENISEISTDYCYSYISKQATIGNNVKIGIGCIIERDVVIGDNTTIHHNVVIRNNTRIGSNCTIYSGTVIGERGFNYWTDDYGNRHMYKHYGGVVIEDDVHIGDSCCISRGAIDDTVIERGVKINKNVVIAHNVIIGKNTIITFPAFICGSVTIGNKCHVAASVIRNQLSVGDNCVLGLGSVVVKNVDQGVTVVGNPARPVNNKYKK